MSMDNYDFSSVKDMLRQLSTEKLRQMLCSELEREEFNPDLIQLLSNILAERTQLTDFEDRTVDQAAWSKFLEDTDKLRDSEQKGKRLMNGIVRAAAVIVFALLMLVPIIPQDAEADGLWDRLSRWTTDIVEFFGSDDNDDRFSKYEFHSSNEGLQQVYESLQNMGIDVPVVPMWLPDNPSLIECKEISTPYKKQLTSCFKDGESEIVFAVSINQEEVAHQYHGDLTEGTQYTFGETTFNIIRNNDAWVVFWNIDEIECTIALDCQEDVLYRILKSIYVMEEM